MGDKKNKVTSEKRYLIVIECDDTEELSSLKEVEVRVQELVNNDGVDAEEITVYEVLKKLNVEVKTTLVIQ